MAVKQDASNDGRNRTYWHWTKGDADYLNTRGTKGNRWRQSDNQTLDTGGRASYLEREGKVSNFSKQNRK